MLPSTGYFKGINCPFYDSGLCERPYCHFRHTKKDSIAGSSNDGIESGEILQKLVSAAVQKVLQQTETSSTMSPPYTIAEEVGPTTTTNNIQTKATYNPTPIAELNKIVGTDTDTNDDTVDLKKKHIPVPYTPRKPAGLPIQRPLETNGSPKPFIYIPPPMKYTPGCSEAMKLESYTPKGFVESSETYLPGSDPDIELQEYTPHEAHKAKPSKHNYIPSDKNCSKKKILEYKPSKIKGKTEIPKVTYQPTPKSLNPCFSSDEEPEPDVKKFKLNDLNSLDDLGPEFDILDQILDDEKPRDIKEEIKDQDVEMVDLSKNKEESLGKTLNEKMDESHRKHTSSSHKNSDKAKSRDETKLDTPNQKHKQKGENNHKRQKSSSDKHENRKSESTSKSEKKASSSHHKNDTKAKESSRKSNKSLNKEREEKKEKSRDDNKKHSDSRKMEKSLKHSENTSKSSRSSSSSRKNSSSSSSRKDSKKESRKKDRHKSSRETDDKYKKRKQVAEIDNDEHDDRHFDGNDLESIPNEENYELSESDEETIALECKRIFEEYVPVAKPNKKVDEVNSSNQILDSSDIVEYIPGKKRISRTADKIIKIAPKIPLKPDHKVNASQAMAERLAKVKEYHAQRKSVDSNSAPTQQNLAPKCDAPRNTKIRIAHVPYASTLLSAKKTINPSVQTRNEEPSTSSTVIQTVKKGSQRVAHLPNEKLIDRPGVLEPLASKIPANVRSTYLNMMIDECLKIYLSATDAYARAQHEELATSKKCSKVQVYKNSAVLTISRLRKELLECNGVKKSGADCTNLQKVPHSMSGTANNLGSWSIENQNRRTVDTSKEFIGVKFYNNLKKWILTEEQLQENGFPRPHVSGEKGRAIIHGQNKKPPPRGYIRTCCRCKKDYTVDKKSFPAVKEECIYHPNNKYRVRGEVKYQCCNQDSSSDGCCIAPCHVYEYVDYDNLKGYIRTMPPNSNTDDYGVYSLDCEMCYTTHGLDLTRVTVINSSCKVVYETLIKPLHPIIDYNTRYSGITAEHMANVSTTLLEVQATLLSMFNSKTILVGHSLESDFKALKLIHDTVIDTSVLFPHKMGPPYKRALRNLSSEYLKKIIQNSVEGHDSAEDATVCMELVIYKLKEDLKTR